MNIQLLGSPQVHFTNGLRPVFKTAKAAGLLYFLAATQRTHSRAALAALLWGDMEEAKARVNLSKALSELREQLGDYITITTQTVTFNKALTYYLDVETFLAAALNATAPKQATQSVANMQSAADIYRGPFLDGFFIRNAPEFEHWQLAERERLRGSAVRLLTSLAAHYFDEGSVPDAVGTLRQLLQLEPWREEAHYQLMGLLAGSGEYHAALRQYELCRAALANELDVEPGEEITRLYTALRINPTATWLKESQPAPTAIAAVAERSHPPVPHNLPYPPTAFIGRAAEIQELVDRLENPACRLLTLIGPGGIGKTRLALEVAHAFVMPPMQRVPEHETQTVFSDGVFFVNLIPVDTSAGIVAAIAEAVGFSFYSDTPPLQQLFGYLRSRKLLLLLDNFEHMADASSLLSELAAAAPGLKLLVTSRTALPLHYAELHAVQGLSYPGAQQPGSDSGGTEDAVQLFVQSARRHQGAFAAAQHMESIVAICRLVHGMPLALELAAAWLKSLPCAAIVRELEKGMALLRAEVGDIEARHRNLQAVLEQTWQRLDPEEAHAMARLALFRGGFTLEAAEVVAGTSPYVLAGLVENALIRLDEYERYQVHELLRQFAYTKLAASADYEVAAVAHAHYFFTLVIARKEALSDSRQPAALAAIQAEIDNVRTAWQWAIRQPDMQYVVTATDTLYDFFRYTCRYSEGKELFAGAARRRAAPANMEYRTSVEFAEHLDVLAAVFSFHLGEHAETSVRLEAVLAAADDGRAANDIATADTFLGFIAGWQGRFPVAERHLQASIAYYERTGDRSSLAGVLYGMSDMYAHSGWFQKAVDCAQRCLTLGMQLGRNDLLGNAHCELAFALKSLGHPKLALEHYRKGCSYSERSGDRLAYSMSIGGIGIELCQLGKEEWDEGFALIEQSLAICEELGHSLHIATRLYSLQQACIEGERYAEAMPYAEELIRVANAIGFRRGLTYCYLGMAESYLGLGDLAMCRQQLQLALGSCEGIEWNFPALSHVIVYYALLLEQEAARFDATAARQHQMQAVTLAASALRWPGWRAYHCKAEDLIERQGVHLTAAELAVAMAAAEKGTLEEIATCVESALTL